MDYGWEDELRAEWRADSIIFIQNPKLFTSSHPADQWETLEDNPRRDT